MITLLIFVPLLGTILVSVVPQKFARTFALISTASTALFALMLWHNFDTSAAGLQFVERHSWIPLLAPNTLLALTG